MMQHGVDALEHSHCAHTLHIMSLSLASVSIWDFIRFCFCSIWLLPSPRLSSSSSLHLLFVEVSRDQEALSCLLSLSPLVLLTSLIWLCDRTEIAPCSLLQLVSLWIPPVHLSQCLTAGEIKQCLCLPLSLPSLGHWLCPHGNSLIWSWWQAGSVRAPLHVPADRERHEMALYDKLPVA